MKHTALVLDDIASIAREAGKRILQHFGKSSLSSQLKEDSSPVAAADLEASSYLCQALSELSGLPVLSEELPVDYDVRKNWNEFWLVDPLDGTREFIAEINEFTVNIALVRAGHPVIGIIFAPALDELYFAKRGDGAYLTKDGACHRLPCFETVAPLAVIGRFHKLDLVNSFLAANNISDVSVLGSALKFGRLAAGSFSIYPRYQRSKEWDIAAGQVILQEAGGCIVDASSGKELAYNKVSLENPFFIACSGKVQFDTLKLIEPHE